MLHPDILRSYMYRRTQCGAYALDACRDASEFFGVSTSMLATFLCALRIDAPSLSRI